MALQSFLALASGKLARIFPLQASAGVASAGALIALNAAGLVDTSMIGLSGRNLVINGNFAINQRGYASGASLASNAYGHDRWKNIGASAGSYTFTQATPPTTPNAPSSPDTTITIPSGVTLGQVIESLPIGGGSYILSWTGTATATVYYYTSSSVLTAVVSGVSSGAVFTLPAGAYAALAFTNGTLGKVQLEQGTQPTPFERRLPQQEFELCQRYYQLFSQETTAGFSTTTTVASFGYAVPMRVAPTLTLLSAGSLIGNGGSYTPTSINSDSVDIRGASLDVVVSGGGLSAAASYNWRAFLLSASAEL